MSDAGYIVAAVFVATAAILVAMIAAGSFNDLLGW
jgi:hypothetical protein